MICTEKRDRANKRATDKKAKRTTKRAVAEVKGKAHENFFKELDTKREISVFLS